MTASTHPHLAELNAQYVARQAAKAEARRAELDQKLDAEGREDARHRYINATVFAYALDEGLSFEQIIACRDGDHWVAPDHVLSQRLGGPDIVTRGDIRTAQNAFDKLLDMIVLGVGS